MKLYCVTINDNGYITKAPRALDAVTSVLQQLGLLYHATKFKVSEVIEAEATEVEES